MDNQKFAEEFCEEFQNFVNMMVRRENQAGNKSLNLPDLKKTIQIIEISLVSIANLEERIKSNLRDMYCFFTTKVNFFFPFEIPSPITAKSVFESLVQLVKLGEFKGSTENEISNFYFYLAAFEVFVTTLSASPKRDFGILYMRSLFDFADALTPDMPISLPFQAPPNNHNLTPALLLTISTELFQNKNQFTIFIQKVLKKHFYQIKQEADTFTQFMKNETWHSDEEFIKLVEKYQEKQGQKKILGGTYL